MIDYTGIPSLGCPNCGSAKFKTWVMVDPDTYEIGMYATDGECNDCGTKMTIVVPGDHPDFIEEEIEQEIEDDEY
jgi:predicted  nucleic acid-binding Zn-ribbon protein